LIKTPIFRHFFVGNILKMTSSVLGFTSVRRTTLNCLENLFWTVSHFPTWKQCEQGDCLHTLGILLKIGLNFHRKIYLVILTKSGFGYIQIGQVFTNHLVTLLESHCQVVFWLINSTLKRISQ
jgi:hypothetical protein